MFAVLGRYRSASIVLAVISTISLPADALTILETAQFTGIDTGEFIISSNRFIGASFVLSSASEITSIGGQFGGFPSGSIFGAIVQLTSQTALPGVPPSQLPSASLADIVFSVPRGTRDLIEPLSVTLNPGSYAVIFGSGLFGTNGSAGFGDQNILIDSPVFLQSFSGTWESFSPDGVRIVVNGVPAPRPVTGAGLPGLIAASGGLLLLGWLRGRRKIA